MLGDVLEEARELGGPDGIEVRSGKYEGDPVVEFYTGRWRPMLNADEVQELRDILDAWLTEQGR